MGNKVLVVGAGIAGMEVSIGLCNLGFDVVVLEKTAETGGHVKDWHQLFPNQRPSDEVVEDLRQRLARTSAEILLNADLLELRRNESGFSARTNGRAEIQADAVVVATGFELFDARIKEEYGYGIYDHVITSAELEARLKAGETITNAARKPPRRVGVVHCVGSRDEKVGNTYCSQVCCVTAVKQAIELRKLYPQAEVFCFYMDLRMFGLHFEDLYKEAQEKWGVNFIRGRLSEASENLDGTIVVKVEDTLAGRPLKMNVDLLVLMVGFMPSKQQVQIAQWLDTPLNTDGFFVPADEHLNTGNSIKEGVFLTGTAKGPKTISDTLADARAVVLNVRDYLVQQEMIAG